MEPPNRGIKAAGLKQPRGGDGVRRLVHVPLLERVDLFGTASQTKQADVVSDNWSLSCLGCICAYQGRSRLRDPGDPGGEGPAAECAEPSTDEDQQGMHGILRPRGRLLTIMSGVPATPRRGPLK